MRIDDKLWIWWKRVGLTIFFIGLGLGLWAGELDIYYQTALPRHSDPIAGNIYPLNVHGILVYQTRSQRDKLDGFLYSAIALGVVASIMAAIQRKFDPAYARSSLGFEPTWRKPK